MIQVARHKMDTLPTEQIAGLMETDGRIRILTLPRLEHAVTMSNRKLQKLLRFCPLSDHFGCTRDELNERVYSKTRSCQIVCQLINGNLRAGGLSEIDEKESFMENGSVVIILGSDN